MNPIGAHMSIVGGPSKAFQRIQAVGGECFQIFVKPSVQWQAGELSLEEAAEFIAERERTGIGPVVAHASYLLNLASPEKELREQVHPDPGLGNGPLGPPGDRISGPPSRQSPGGRRKKGD